MKKIENVALLFEQSGTFKAAFNKFGFNAIDIDINNSFGETDYQIDIFKDLNKWDLLCDNFLEDILISSFKADIVIAFFPCTFFSTMSELNCRSDNFSCRDLTLSERISRAREFLLNRENYLDKLFLLVEFCDCHNLPLIIENPYHCNYLLTVFPFKPAIIDKDRRLYGDNLKKPTMFYFFNYPCQPRFIPIYPIVEDLTIDKLHGFSRCLISNTYAENFVLRFFEV